MTNDQNKPEHQRPGSEAAPSAHGAASQTLKAFIVTENEENTGGVVFAKTAIEARRWGANEFNDGELGGLTVRRKRTLDQYAKTGVPASVMVEMGWRYECYHCGNTVSEDDLYEQGLAASDVCGVDNGAIYCCRACEMAAASEKLKRKQLHAETVAKFEAIIVRRFPDADFSEARHHTYFQVHHFDDGREPAWTTEQAVIEFAFPGMKIGRASLRFERGHHVWQRIGPPSLAFFCCGGDRESFEVYAAATSRKNKEPSHG